MRYELVVVGALETNCYLAYCEETRACAIIDPGAEPGKIVSAVADQGLTPVILLNTHGHVDHVGGNKDIIDKYGIPLAIHPADAGLLKVSEYLELSLLLGAKDSPKPERFLSDGDTVPFGRASLRVVHLPGHSPGSVGFLGAGVLFSGDTMFCGGVGRTDLPGGSWKELERSIRERILTLPAETVVLPGHGPWTTVGQERDSNPFLS